MYGIISNNSKRHEEIKKIVKNKGNIIYEKVTENIVLALKEIGRVNVQTVVIDISETFEEDFITGIKNFKVVRDKARIILIVSGRTPGDKLLSQAVAKGIYNLVSDIAGLDEAINNQATYADAVRWDVGEDISQGKEKQIGKVIGQVTDLWFALKKPKDNVWGSNSKQSKGNLEITDTSSRLANVKKIKVSRKKAATEDIRKAATVIVVWNSSGQHMIGTALEMALTAKGILINFNFENPELDSWFGVDHSGECSLQKTGILTMGEQLTKDMVVPMLKKKKGIRFLPVGHKLGQIGAPEVLAPILKEIIETLIYETEIIVISPCARYDALSSLVAFQHADYIIIPYSCPQELKVARNQLGELQKADVITEAIVTECHLPAVDISGVEAELAKVLAN